MSNYSKKTTTVRIPFSLEKKLLGAVIDSGYGMRGKSLWIEEAILKLLETDDYQEHVNWDLTGDGGIATKPMSLTLSSDLDAKLEDAVLEIRKSYPRMEGVKSKTIRAAIMHRIIVPFHRGTCA